MPFNPHPVFVHPGADQILWRFMDFPRFYFLISRKLLYMPSLSSLANDPWEGLPPKSFFDPRRQVIVSEVKAEENVDLGIIQSQRIMQQADFFGGLDNFKAFVKGAVESYKAMKNKVFVSCWHMSETESEALWRLYGGLGFGISIRTTFSKLEGALLHPKPMYAGVVSYLDETKEMLGQNNIFYNCIWKRRSFDHEKEFRIVVMESDSASGISIPINLESMIDSIVVHPSAQQWFLDIVLDLAESVGCRSRVVRSQILNEPDYNWNEK